MKIQIGSVIYTFDGTAWNGSNGERIPVSTLISRMQGACTGGK